MTPRSLLHDTHGFPIDLTLEMAAEAGLDRRHRGLPRADGGAEARARADAKARKGGFGDLTVYRELLDLGATEFTGYSELESEGTVRGLIADGEPGHAPPARATSSSWCWTAPRSTPSPAARSPTPG